MHAEETERKDANLIALVTIYEVLANYSSVIWAQQNLIALCIINMNIVIAEHSCVYFEQVIRDTWEEL